MKTKKTILNFVTDVVPLIIISLLGIYKVKLFLNVLGDETLGLYQLFTNIMVYVSLVDGGLAQALLFSLYKPNANKDNRKINELLSGGMVTFSKIGMLVFTIATITSFFIIFFIKDSPFEYFYIVFTFLLFAISYVIEYFFVSYNAILEVKEKKYLFNLITQLGQITISIVEIILLFSNVKFGYILLSHSIIKLITKIIEVYVCKKEFPWMNVRSEKKDYSFKKYLKSLMVHTINGVVGSNIDPLIISSMMGLKFVAIYSTYNYIVNMLKNILGKMSSSMTAFIGNSLEKEKMRMYQIYLEFDSMLFYIAISICTPLMLAINKFIEIFYNGEIETSILMAIACSLLLFGFIIKLDTVLFVSAGGLYKETRHCAITDTIINLVLSLILVNIIGIPGVIFATFISVMIAEYILKTRVVHKYIFSKSSKYFFIKNIKFFIMFIIDLILGYALYMQFNLTNLVEWLVFFSLFTVINGVMVLGIFTLIKEDSFLWRLKSLVKH